MTTLDKALLAFVELETLETAHCSVDLNCLNSNFCKNLIFGRDIFLSKNIIVNGNK